MMITSQEELENFQVIKVNDSTVRKNFITKMENVKEIYIIS